MARIFILLMLQIPFFVFSQQISNISPNQGTQGQSVPLIISGNNMSFSGWSCWSNTANLSDFRFSQWSGAPPLYGTPLNGTGNTLTGELNIPSFQQTGVYNLEVFDCITASWILFPSSFHINLDTNSTSILNYSNIGSLDVYPNPTKGNINIKFTSLIYQDIKISIVNSIGELVFSENLVGHLGGYSKRINLTTNANGFYFLEIETDYRVVNKKLILQ